MSISTLSLIKELKQLTHKCIEMGEELSKLSIEKLTQKASSESWSALECIEHLNRYGNFYLPEIKHVIEGAKSEVVSEFKPGVLGNYFVKSMKVKPKLNKMKTFKEMNTNHCSLDLTVLDTFLKQQQTMLQLLEQAKSVNCTRLKTKISISKFIKLRLGDTFGVVIYHNERHLLQAKRSTVL